MRRTLITALIITMSSVITIAQNNPLLGSFNTPHQTAPFGEIKNGHFIPAFQEAIKQGEAEIEFIAGNLGKPTFDNTIAALDRSGRLLSRTAGVFFNLMSAETSDELQQIAQEVSPMLTKFQNDINLNPKLFERVNYLYYNRMNLNLTPEQSTLLENTYTNFVQKGAKLKDDQKERYREITTELARLSLTFDENVLKTKQNSPDCRKECLKQLLLSPKRKRKPGGFSHSICPVTCLL